MVQLGTTSRLHNFSPVNGDTEWFRSQVKMASRSYVKPSAATTGSRITLHVRGQWKVKLEGVDVGLLAKVLAVVRLTGAVGVAWPPPGATGGATTVTAVPTPPVATSLSPKLELRLATFKASCEDGKEEEEGWSVTPQVEVEVAMTVGVNVGSSGGELSRALRRRPPREPRGEKAEGNRPPLPSPPAATSEGWIDHMLPLPARRPLAVDIADAAIARPTPDCR